MRTATASVFLVFAACVSATTPPPTATPPLPEPPLLELSADVMKERVAALERARADYEKSPNDADAIIWLGRRTAYLGRYREAIEIFSEGIRKHPGDARMYRHRGHRYITMRQFDLAIRDLDKAAALVKGKPDENWDVLEVRAMIEATGADLSS